MIRQMDGLRHGPLTGLVRLNTHWSRCTTRTNSSSSGGREYPEPLSTQGVSRHSTFTHPDNDNATGSGASAVGVVAGAKTPVLAGKLLIPNPLPSRGYLRPLPT